MIPARLEFGIPGCVVAENNSDKANNCREHSFLRRTRNSERRGRKGMKENRAHNCDETFIVCLNSCQALNRRKIIFHPAAYDDRYTPR